MHNRLGRSQATHAGIIVTLAALLSWAACGSSGSESTDAAPATDSGTALADAASPDATTTTAPNVCVETCSGAGACSPGSTCNGSRCVIPDPAQASCTVATDCVPFASSWDDGTPCDASTPCTTIEECVDVKGSGFCVRKPTQPNTCANRRTVEVQWPDLNGTMVTVCGRSNFVCEGQTCTDACTKDDDCIRSSYPSCDVETNRCVCDTNSCGSIWGSACLPSGQCGCSSNSHCNRAGFDYCYGDQCGCENATTCEGLAAATVVCEPLP